MIRFRSVLPLLVVVAALAGAAVSPAGAASKPTPSPAPAPSPTATPEPLDIQIPRLEEEVKAHPDDTEAEDLLAFDYLQVNRPDLAVQLTQKLIKGGSKSGRVYFVDGAAQASLGNEQAAVASMEQASNLEPTNITVLQSLTQMYLRDNRFADAERVARRALTFNASDEQAMLNLGVVLAVEKKYDDARAQFEAAAKANPQDAHPLALEAQTYIDQNSPTSAMTMFNRAIAADPKDIEGYVGKARLQTAQKDVNGAVATYGQVLSLQSSDTDRAAVMDQIAEVYAAAKMDTQADAEFRQAIGSYASVPEAHLVYGDYLASRNDKAGAQREWTSALGANKDNPDALVRLGTAAAQSAQWPTAITDYKRLTDVASRDPRSWFLLGQAFMGDRQYESARDAFKASYNLSHTPDAVIGLAAADQQTHNFGEAEQIYESIDKVAPNLVKQNPQILYQLAQTYDADNQKQKARATYVRYLAYLKPGTQQYNQVRDLIGALDRGGSKPAQKPTAKPTSKPH